MSLKTADLETVFRKLGAELKPCKHHVRGIVRFGSYAMPIYYSHGRKDIPTPVIGKMARSLRVSSETFVGMCRCRITREEYFNILRDGT